jgi:hypothetical protein
MLFDFVKICLNFKPNTKNKLFTMEKIAIKKNQKMVNILFIAILVCIYLFDQRTFFINGAIQGIKDFGIFLP